MWRVPRTKWNSGSVKCSLATTFLVHPSPFSDASEGHFPFGSLSSRPYYGRDAETVQVKWIYRAVNFLTDLFFGVDKDLDHLPEKRRSVAPSTKTGTELLLPTVSVLPPAISAGYGELSWQGFDKVVYWMACEAPDFVRMGPSSIFLDIGSGFGKCVFHAKLRAQVARSVGIECIKTRHEKASEALHLLRAGFVPGLSDTKDAPKFETRDLDRQLVGCELFEGDVSLPKFHPLVHASTHIYAFDVVFSRETHAQILPIVEASDFHLFGCYLNPAKLASFGCTRFALLHTIKVHTTGKQSFTCYFYMKKEPVSPNGLHTIAPVRQTRRSTTTTTTAVAGLDPATDEFWNKMHEEAATPEPYLTEALAAVANPTPEAIAAAAASAQAALKDGLSQTLTTLCPVRGSRAKKPAAVTASPAASPVKAAKPDDTAAVTAPPATSKTNKAAKTTSSSSKKKPTTASKTTGKSTTPTKSSSKKSKSTSSSSSKKKKVEVVVSAKSKKTEAPKSKSSKKRKSVAPEEEEEEEEQEEEVTPPPAPFVKVKQLTRSELFNLSTAAALAPKPKVPRRTNNSLVVKCEPVAYVPKQLSHYLADPTREAEPILVEPTSSNTNDNTVTTAATTAAAEPSPAKKQRV